MGRLVKIDTGWQSVTAVQDLIEIQLSPSQYANFCSAKVMQSSEEASTDVEELKVSVKRAGGTFTNGSGGQDATVTKYGRSSQSAAGFTLAKRNNTTQALVGTGTLDELWPGAFDVMSGEWDFTPPDSLRPEIGPSESIIFSLEETPADAITMRAVILLEILVG